MKSDLVRIHHAPYQEDIPFWIACTKNLDPILEIGSGHGRVTLPLLKEGHQVVAVDRDVEPMSYLRKAVGKSGPEVRQRASLVQTDILDFQPKEPFGAVIIPCNTYSTFDLEDRLALIAKINSFLRHEGLLIISLPNPVLLAEAFHDLHDRERKEDPDLETSFFHPATGFPVQVSSRTRASTRSLMWDWIYDHLYPDGNVERIVVTAEHFLTSRETILAELGEGGLHTISCQGDYAGGAYSESAPYLILICQK